MNFKMLLVVGLLAAVLVNGCDPTSDSQGPSKTAKTCPKSDVAVEDRSSKPLVDKDSAGCCKKAAGKSKCSKNGVVKQTDKRQSRNALNSVLSKAPMETTLPNPNEIKISLLLLGQEALAGQ